MKKAFVYIIFSLSLLFTCSITFAQDKPLTLEQGVQAHAGIDALYHEFARAYETLDAQHFKTIYAEDTYYLAPQAPIYFGNNEVAEKGFADWFASVKQDNASLSASFTIIAREIHDDLGFDVGYIKSLQKTPGKDDAIYEAKILVVIKKQENGEWLFQADTYSYLE